MHSSLLLDAPLHQALLPFGCELEGPCFLDDMHLALEPPSIVVSLDALGYDTSVMADYATAVAQTNTFQVLSHSGMEMLAQEIKRLEPHAVESPRIPHVLRGTAFRSHFIRGFCHSKALSDFVSRIAGCRLVPHPMTIMEGHINLKPKDDSQNVDRWHFDTTPFAFILFCTDPKEYSGGEFEFFNGTIQEGEALLQSGLEIPADRCRNAGEQLQGHAIFQQGWKILHRANRVTEGGARTTFVQSFAPADVSCREACTVLSNTYNGVDPLHMLLPDWARFRSWRAARLLDAHLLRGGSAANEQKKLALAAARDRLVVIVLRLPYRASRSTIAGCLRDALEPVRMYATDVDLVLDVIVSIENAAKDVEELRDPTMAYY